MTLNLRFLFAAIATAAIILTALSLPVIGQRKNDPATLPFSDAPYRVGERLTYNVSFANFVTAGHVELSVVARGSFMGRDSLQLRAHVETTGVVYAALYALDDDYISYVDPGTGLPFHGQHIVQAAPQKADMSSDFNQSAAAGAFDFLSALYRMRALPLADGSNYDLNVNDASQSYQVELKVKGREAVKTNVGSFNAIVSQVKIQNNSHANDYRIQIYFSDDARHIPVLITARHPAGQIRAELAAAQVTQPGPGKLGPPTELLPQATPTPTPAGGSPATNNLAAGLPFRIGEQLNYQVYLQSVQQPVGLISYQVRARARYFDRDGLMLTCSAQTTNAAQRLFFANDQFTSYVDPQTLLPFRSEFNIAEGRRRSTEILTIDQDRGAATRQTGGRIEVPVGTHDYLSILYAVRAMNITQRSALSILVNNRPRTLVVNMVRRETIDLGSQKIPAIQISLTTMDDAQTDKFVLRAWISDDGRRLPLRFTATTELGALRADLVTQPLTRQ